MTAKVGSKLVFYIVALVVMVLLAGYLGMLGSDIEEKTNEIVDKYGPEISFGLDELQGGDVELPPAIRSEVDSLKGIIVSMLASSNQNCFRDIPEIPQLAVAGKQASVTFLRNDHNDTTTMIIKGDKSSIAEFEQINDMRPCVIAGTDQIAENFFDKYIKGRSVSGAHSMQVQAVSIFYSENRLNGNRLKVASSGWPLDAVNDESDNFQSRILYKDVNNKICFIPSNKIVNADKDGIDNDYLTDPSDSDSLLYKVKNGQVAQC